MNLYRWLAALAVTGIACPAFGQVVCTGLEPDYKDCKDRQRLEEYRRERG